MNNIYDSGDKTRIKITFKVDEVEADPMAAIIIIKFPDGAFQSFISSAGFSSQGNWDAAANNPALADGTGTVGDYYIINVAGTQNLGHKSQIFAVGDYIAYDGDVWLLIPTPQTETLTKDATGVYFYSLPVHQEGTHFYRGEGFGIVHAAAEDYFVVRRSVIR